MKCLIRVRTVKVLAPFLITTLNVTVLSSASDPVLNSRTGGSVEGVGGARDNKAFGYFDTLYTESAFGGSGTPACFFILS
ncbi:uncharacterized protein C8R40DRAFT_1131028 [Lentinula edodes]|uniref:uncharacterized protein n=1 Tax=Lentinula edodes TaxID=5353 RepID=UPI001E8D3D68|nr:uncharacterized protein C8R40DRAFT_1131028 [Lentinula edodes]KAH7869434.1 hypothetical protein C8R40DRAFT_1131028 [Lentinula edodes]